MPILYSCILPIEVINPRRFILFSLEESANRIEFLLFFVKIVSTFLVYFYSIVLLNYHFKRTFLFRLIILQLCRYSESSLFCDLYLFSIVHFRSILSHL